MLFEPTADDTRGTGGTAGFANAKHEADDKQRNQSAGYARECSKQRPPKHNLGQDLAVTVAVAVGSHGDLHQAITQNERTLHPSPFGGREVQVFHDGRTGHADVDAVEKGDDAQNDEHRQYENLFLFQCWSLSIY